MLKEIIGVGDTELEALNDAKRQLGLDETDEVEFELIQRAEKKKFGLFGGLFALCSSSVSVLVVSPTGWKS